MLRPSVLLFRRAAIGKRALAFHEKLKVLQSPIPRNGGNKSRLGSRGLEEVEAFSHCLSIGTASVCDASPDISIS